MISISPIFPGICISLYNRCLEAVGVPTLEYTTQSDPDPALRAHPVGRDAWRCTGKRDGGSMFRNVRGTIRNDSRYRNLEPNASRLLWSGRVRAGGHMRQHGTAIRNESGEITEECMYFGLVVARAGAGLGLAARARVNAEDRKGVPEHLLLPDLDLLGPLIHQVLQVVGDELARAPETTRTRTGPKRRMPSPGSIGCQSNEHTTQQVCQHGAQKRCPTPQKTIIK